MLRRTVAPAVAVGLVMLSSAPALAAKPAPYPPPSTVSGHVEPDRIRPGECATFSGQGFSPSRSIVVTDNEAPAGTSTTDASGRFAKQVCYPGTTRPGRHTLRGTGDTSSGTQTASAVLHIQGVKQSSGQVATTDDQALGSARRVAVGDTASPWYAVFQLSAVSMLVLLVLFAALWLLLVERRRRRERRARHASPQTV